MRELVARAFAATRDLPSPIREEGAELNSIAAAASSAESVAFAAYDLFKLAAETLFAFAMAEARNQGLELASDSGLLAETSVATYSATSAVERAQRVGEALTAQTVIPGFQEFLTASTPDAARAWHHADEVTALRNRWIHGNRGDASTLHAMVEQVVVFIESLRMFAGVTVETDPSSTTRLVDIREITMDDKPHAGLPVATVVAPGATSKLVLDPFVVVMPAEPHRVFVMRPGRDTRNAFIFRSADDCKVEARLGASTSAPVVQPAQPEPHPVESVIESLGRAAGPLHRFVMLLKRHLDRDAFAHLEQRFSAMGYVGSQDAQLIEYCLARDLREVLDELFSQPALHRIARSVGLSPHPLEAKNELLEQIFTALEVPVPATPIGLSTYRDRVRRANAALRSADDRAAIRGIIGEAGTALERVLGDLVSFYGRIALGSDFVQALRDVGALRAHQTLNRASLGTLFDALGRIEAIVTRPGTPESRRFSELFPDRPHLLGPVGAKQKQLIARTRNSFSHPSDELERMDVARLRQVASEMFGSLLPLFEFLENARVYPPVVAVRETVSDAFGRRFVRAIDEHGHEETIYTNDPLAPGELYFMHPLTNPVRIFPILLRVGG